MRIIDYINQGGPIMYVLLVLNIIGFTIILTKLVLLSKEKKNSDDTALKLSQNIKDVSSKAEQITLIELAKQELTKYMNGVESGLNTIKIIASISPLLGLLGTVIGVLMAFQVMSESGLANPASFAKGISMALITTVGGLVVAIPHYVGHNYLLGLVDKIESDIEQKLLGKII